MRSIRYKLIVLIIPALSFLLCGELFLTYREQAEAANSAYDRSLAGALKVIESNVSTAGGGFHLELPYNVLKAFHLTYGGRFYYRISTEDGLIDLGNAELPKTAQKLHNDQPTFYNAEYFGHQLRVGAYVHEFDKPLYGSGKLRVTLQVAEGLNARQGVAQGLLTKGIALDALLVLAVAAIMAFGVIHALRPLNTLRTEMLLRDKDNLAPIDANMAPTEVRPFIEAINRHIQKSAQSVESERHFHEDVSHQLRTPLAVLCTQVEYALREPDIACVHEALGAMKTGINRSVRMVNQILALAKARSATPLLDMVEKFDLAKIAEEVGLSALADARLKDQDFGLQRPDLSVLIRGNEALLREALCNIAQNAVRYTPAHGRITISVGHRGSYGFISVCDSGPGMSPHELSHAGERFFKGSASMADSAGLGLAITKTIVEQHGGMLALTKNLDAAGLTVEITIPLHQQI